MISIMPFGFLFVFIFLFGTVMSLSSLHWLGIWAGLEINLMGFIPILVYRGVTQEAESGMKYFIVQALGSGMIMAGSLISFNVLYSWEVHLNADFSAGLGVLLFGLMLKLGSFPFHFWLPSVMAGISWFGCLILATWQKIAPLFLLGSVLQGWALNSFLGSFLALMAGFSSMVGGIGGLNQTQVRALLAYSSIGHIGWMIFAMLVGNSALKMYFMIYFFVSGCFFLSLWWFETSRFSQVSILGSEESKMGQVCMIFMLLSLGGMPPLLGFVGKWLVIWFSCEMLVPFSIIFLLIGSLISLFYYLSLLFSLSFLSGTVMLSKGNFSSLLNLSFMQTIKSTELIGENKNNMSSDLSDSDIFGFSLSLGVSLIISFLFILNLVGGALIIFSLSLAEFI
uniref:NADH-ubiquinone oxidoreductase chain 2 n=1 Tax=Cittarium pica TaxID=164121 RepID=A0A1W5YRY5_CITPI|nr:NADH dehydrogenase subunit 2 [Cittarium pica]